MFSSLTVWYFPSCVSVSAQQEAWEDAVTSRISSHPSVVFSLQPNLLIPWQVDSQATWSHLEPEELKFNHTVHVFIDKGVAVTRLWSTFFFFYESFPPHVALQ